MKTNKILALTLAALMLCTTLAACGDKPAPESTTSNASDSASDTTATEEKILIGKIEQNSIEEARVNRMKENAVKPKPQTFKSFPSMNSMLLDMQAGRIDTLVVPSSVADYLASKDDKLLTRHISLSDHFHMATRAEDTELTEELNGAIDALKTDGTLDKLIADYVTNATGDPAVNTLASNPDGETHVVAITGDLPPLDFVAADGTPAGFNVALLNAIAEKNGCNFEIVQVDAAARLSALESGKIDLIFWIDCLDNADFETEQDGVTLTAPYFEGTRAFVSYSAEVLEIIKSQKPTLKK